MLLRLQLGGAEERDLCPLFDSGEDLGKVVVIQADLNGHGLWNAPVVDEEHNRTPDLTPRCGLVLGPRPPSVSAAGSEATARAWTGTGTRRAAAGS